ncbi:hypothetical protein HPB47_026110 [Ixodes persulcatus]|uniref:Uncharacterized protein n=1 Tax=Ixodes persulcatus TaxID=34615 RepID=A0AC60Q021_IXOPE|nr:hypothetical protein HPB47_026110 [Ixodes persulcatus]
MSSSASPGTSAGKRKVLSLKLKCAILDEVRRNVKKTDIVQKYDIAQSTLSTIIKNAGKIDAVLDDDVGGGDRKRIQPGTGWPGTGWQPGTAAIQFLTFSQELDGCSGSDRHDITCKNIVNEAASVGDPSLQKWMEKNLDRILGTLKVPLEKAIFFASGAWRDIKPQTILHCFQKGGFSRSSGADEIPARNVAAAADGDAAATCLGRLWETASKVGLVPPGLDHMNFAFADDNIVATEDVSTEDLAKSVVDESADGTASDDDCDNGRISQPVTSGAAVAAVDVLRMYFRGSDPSFDLQFDKFEAAIVKRSLANSVQGTLDGFLQKE